MSGTTIVCLSCQRRWQLPGTDPAYSQMDLSTRPCPHCEAYTLSYQEPASARPSGRFRPSWRRADVGPRRPALRR
jgi:hypothetical protein